jgi:hypothetical protein
MSDPVKRRNALTLERCPLYPQKRTSLGASGMSALCQKRTHATQQRWIVIRSRDGGIVTPSALAVLRFIASLNLLDRMTLQPLSGSRVRRERRWSRVRLRKRYQKKSAKIVFGPKSFQRARIKLAYRPAASAEPRSAAISYHFRARSRSAVMETAPSCLMTDGS